MTTSNDKLKDMPNKIETDGGLIKETDAMGREIFWQDMGRPDDGK